MRIVTSLEMKRIEEIAQNSYGLSEELICENVGAKGGNLLYTKLFSNFNNLDPIFLIGKGSNGAFGLAIARHLSTQGVRVRAFTFFDEESESKEMKHQLSMAKSFGVVVNRITSFEELEAYFLHAGSDLAVIDALFGVGVQLPLSNFMYEIINFINEHSSFTVSIDMPSGVEGDTGFIQGNAIQADLTFAIGFPKLGYYVADGTKYTGEIEIIDIALPNGFEDEADKCLLEFEQASAHFSLRNKFGDKKSNGHTLILGGSHGLTGAVAMASVAALNVGSGLTTASTWEPQYQEMIARLSPEIMTGYIPMDINKWPHLIADLKKYSSIVVGPGLARSTRARRLVLDVLQGYMGPVILDADAINVLNMKEDSQIFSMRNAPTILTPHFGEFARFTGIPYEDVMRKPVEYLKGLIEEINCSVVLKGPCTFLGFPNGKVFFNYFPNDGMATGGMGDVLAGIMGGLLAQKDSFNSSIPLAQRYAHLKDVVCASVTFHTLAGKIALDENGGRAMSPLKLIEAFPKAFKEFDHYSEDK